ncbi:MAG: radical SAM protein [Rikenellaceae bacterium]|nr:radical SAM protein [Rikenellaceae bacterium]
MATSLFGDVIFGPVRSRRLGLSLGVNLLPTDSKLCNFNCIYCECGWNMKGARPRFVDRKTVYTLLREKLAEMESEGTPPDVITFAGNGEPTIHPDFPAIIDDTIALRDELCPSAGISVLTNGTMICREEVRGALMKVDNNIVKLDSAFDKTVRLIDNPQGAYSVGATVECMKAFGGQLIIQTMFLRGHYKGEIVDNTTDEEVSAWLDIIKEVAPEKVMVYTIDRATPAEGLVKVGIADLEEIAGRVRALGIECTVAG